MNISKNLLSLGLIAVISGISTAQTYTATAGTNGVTDIQSDYSMSTGDGASVSVDVPLEFELPKKVMLALKKIDGTLPANPEFDGVRSLVESWGPNVTQLAYSGVGSPGCVLERSEQSFYIRGALYTNSDNVGLEIANSDLIHESDPNSIITPGTCGSAATHYNNTNLSMHNADGKFYGGAYTKEGVVNNISITSTTDGAVGFWNYFGIKPDTVDPTDRAGLYTGTQTITVSIL